MKPVFICFNEAYLNDEIKFTLDFLDEEIVHEVLFFPKIDYYVTSNNFDLKLFQDLNMHKDISNDTKELSEKSQLLLEKGLAYENGIKNMKLCIGVSGTFTHVPVYIFDFSNTHIQNFVYKLLDIMI